MVGTPAFAIYANATALVLSGMVTLFMPNLDTKTEVKVEQIKVNASSVLNVKLLPSGGEAIWIKEEN